ncbi:sulfatase-like hydrolase/transferase [Polaribacter sp. Q13]|uniref:sulfatase-like hydrolase/transferase n=1 Tax=Polaribacter sp. Q13 TaxID=2806551 RepID=UPI00193B7B07|nr:sulfatase-like hydrolase/transferase [Polaribacter sp. Q13]QVY66130.1 sulfatase-like hydrolase/transferase [Polaribacter sp. Q13]
MKKLVQALVLFLFVFNLNAQKNKPNILWIMTDDQRKDSNAYFNEITTGTKESPLGYVESPSLDKLAKEGVVYPNMHCQSPGCAPSRAGIIMGKYSFRSGVYGFEYFHNNPDFFSQLLPDAMVDQGYQTVLFGKTGVRLKGYKSKKPKEEMGYYQQYVDYGQDLRRTGNTDWDNTSVWGKVNGKGQKVDSRVNFYYPDGTHKSFSRYETISDAEKKVKAEVEKELDILYAYTRSTEDLIIGGVNSMPAGKTLDGNILTEFVSYLKNENKGYKILNGRNFQGVDSSKPVFANLSFHFPHTPVMPPKEFRDRFKDKVYEIPEFDKKELKKLPKQLQDYYKKTKIDGLKYEEKQQAIRDYYAFCAYGDDLIGKAVEEFKAYSKKHKQEYVIVYVCGDHGWQLGEQGVEGKFSPWDLSTHTTAIVVASDKKTFPAGKVYDGFTEYVDIMPTILAAGGADLSEKKFDFLDGYDMGAVLSDKKLKRDYIIGEINHVVGPRAYIKTKDFTFSMQTRPHRGKASKKYPPNVNIKWGIDAPREEVQMALYDLRVDSKERNNVANDKEYVALADWFRKKLGNIVLGDGRVECDWTKGNDFNISNFAKGADDKRIDIPNKIIPKK